MNKLFIIGVVGQQPELKTSARGTSFCSTSVAVKDGYMKEGKWEETTTWLYITIFDKSAENFSAMVNKGDTVMVEGKLRVNEREVDGAKKSELQIQVKNWSRNKKAGSLPQEDAPDKEYKKPATKYTPPVKEEEEDDLLWE